ncbi:transposase [Streptomyces sp. DASNCL29]|uniref:transposase n=1 Tax=Streptomyces sp. DASNCL29 TaxID=2583819 RepID=UPI0014875BFA|nr:transposase [Streptomyces sp. DASNCL29]
MIDSQSVKADAVVGSDSRGFDGGKLINGRKRHVVVDTLGLLQGVMVTAADTGDRTAAHVLLGQVASVHHRLELVWADGGYTGSLVEHCLAAFALVGVFPCLDAGRTLAARNPTRELPAKTGPERSAAVRPPPVAWGARHRAPTPKGGREPTRGPYASRCREHPNRSGDPGGLRLTTARRDSVRRCRCTGSDDGRIGHR